jgi:hypothetical protein
LSHFYSKEQTLGMSNFAKQALNQLERIVHKPVARMRMIVLLEGYARRKEKLHFDHNGGCCHATHAKQQETHARNRQLRAES